MKPRMRLGTSALAACALAAALLAAGCGSEDDDGAIRGEARSVAAFDRIRVDGRTDVIIRPGAPTLTLRGHEREIDGVKTAVSDRTLTIDPEGEDEPLEVTVTLPRLRGVEAEGGGEIELVGVDSDRLELRLDGAGELTASGRVAALDATLGGAGELQLADLRAQRAAVRVEGIGRAEVNVSEELDATVAGVGAIEYHGDPVVRSAAPGLGDVTRARP